MRKRRLFSWLTPLWLLACGIMIFYWRYDTNPDKNQKPHTFSEIQRTIGVMVIVDKYFATEFGPRPEDWAREIVGGASKFFEHWVGVRLILCQYISWPDGVLVNLEQFEAMPKSICDIKLGLTTTKMYQDGEQVSGKSDKDMVILSIRQLGLLHQLFAHELSHLFGAEDINERGFLMYHTDSLGRGWKIDDETWRTLVRNKFQDFDKIQIWRKLDRKLRELAKGF